MNAAGKASTTKEHDLFKWRECDHFLQNVAAVQLGLHEIRQRPEVRDLRKLTALGLAYGGLELPGLAQAIAATQGVRIDAAVAKVSIYGSRATGRQIRAGNYDYVTKFLLKTRPLCLMRNDGNIEKTPVILMDDNCTTCVTLQLARDFIVRLNGDVIGATVIRFPGVNRHVQMAMPGHGFPDPEVLFSFVRGLIAPSPYSRLIFPSPEGNPYLDQTKVFDKAKERIIRYLKKNGTYRLRGK